MCKSDKESSCDCNMPPPRITGPYYYFTIEYPVATFSFDGTYLKWQYPGDLMEENHLGLLVVKDTFHNDGTWSKLAWTVKGLANSGSFDLTEAEKSLSVFRSKETMAANE